MKQKIAIIGAGITGLSVAKYLSDKNYNVTISNFFKLRQSQVRNVRA